MTVKNIDIVLFSEDPLASDALKFTLESKSCKVFVYSNLREGLKHLVIRPPALVIIDEIQSGPSPGSIVSGIRKKLKGFEKPFLFVLDPPKTGNDISGYDASIDGYIERPYSLASIIELVFSLLGITMPSPPQPERLKVPAAGTEKKTHYDPELMAFIESDEDGVKSTGLEATPPKRSTSKKPPEKVAWLDSLSPLDETATREHLDLLGEANFEPVKQVTPIEPAEKKAGTFKSYKGTIMVIDDERFIIKILQTVLEAEGYRVITANNGLEGMKKCKDIIADLILVDLMMPELDGYEFIEIIRSEKDFKEIPIIILSAKPLAQDQGEAFKLGADFYMQKPIEREKLLSVIANLIQTT